MLLLPFRETADGYPMGRSAGRGRGDGEQPELRDGLEEVIRLLKEVASFVVVGLASLEKAGPVPQLPLHPSDLIEE